VLLASTDGTTSTLTSFVLFNGCFSFILSYPFEQGSFSFSRSSPFLFCSLSPSLSLCELFWFWFQFSSPFVSVVISCLLVSIVNSRIFSSNSSLSFLLYSPGDHFLNKYRYPYFSSITSSLSSSLTFPIISSLCLSLPLPRDHHYHSHHHTWSQGKNSFFIILHPRLCVSVVLSLPYSWPNTCGSMGIHKSPWAPIKIRKFYGIHSLPFSLLN